MNILIFDMDGVLLEPNGYHRALQETVRLVGESLGLSNGNLSTQSIARFEAAGISSEWHSSAICVALMKMGDLQADAFLVQLDSFFAQLAKHPIAMPPVQRSALAIETLSQDAGIDAEQFTTLLDESESIDNSLTMQIFQELVLGSVTFEAKYTRAAQLHTDSYLELYDRALLGGQTSDALLHWIGKPDNGAAIMTNRPSDTLLGEDGMPDAEIGAALVGLQSIPIIGYGEIIWLAEQTNKGTEVLGKPAWPHALSGMLAASGWTIEDSLRYIVNGNLEKSRIDQLQGSRITVFEDTPAGLSAIDAAQRKLREANIEVDVRKVGIAEDETKMKALHAQGAVVYPTLEIAFAELDYF